MKVHSRDAFGHHARHGIRTAAAHADHLDPRARAPLFIVLQFKTHWIEFCDLELSHGQRSL